MFLGVFIIIVSAEIGLLLGSWNRTTGAPRLLVIVAVLAGAKKDEAENEDGRDTNSDYGRIAILLHQGHRNNQMYAIGINSV